MTWWDKTVAWFDRYWQWVVAGIGSVAAVAAAIVVGRSSRDKPSPVVPPVGDPSPALGPLADIGPQVDKIDEVVREDAAQDAVEAKEAHDAIDAADSIADVNAVLYGRQKSGGDIATPAVGGKTITQWVSDKKRER
jgi:hypothetical protein